MHFDSVTSNTIVTLSMDRLPTRRSSQGNLHAVGRASEALPTSSLVTTEPPRQLSDVFLVGPENRILLGIFATASIRELGSVSPVYFYGNQGMGKSVIAYSLASRYCRLSGQNDIAYVNGSDFARSFASALHADDMEHFRSRYRNASIFVMDGLHEIANKESVQTELMYTLETLSERSTPVIFTSNVLPSLIRGLRPSLASRCMSGLSCNLASPSSDTRFALLRLFTRQSEIRLQDDELCRLSEKLPAGTTALEMHSILLNWHHRERTDANYGYRHADQAFDQIIESRNLTTKPAIADISKRVSKSLGVRLQDMKDETRKSHIVRARSLAMYLAREWSGLSYQQIGEFFGGRDHTTVLHACRKMETESVADRELSRIVEEIARQLEIPSEEAKSPVDSGLSVAQNSR